MQPLLFNPFSVHSSGNLTSYFLFGHKTYLILHIARLTFNCWYPYNVYMFIICHFGRNFASSNVSYALYNLMMRLLNHVIRLSIFENCSSRNSLGAQYWVTTFLYLRHTSHVPILPFSFLALNFFFCSLFVDLQNQYFLTDLTCWLNIKSIQQYINSHIPLKDYVPKSHGIYNVT